MTNDYTTGNSASEAEIRKKIEELDLTIVAWKLHLPPEKDGLGWSIEKVAEMIQQYRGFLFVIWKFPDDIAVPTHDLDEVWHTHILFTDKYKKDCKHIFGKYVDHNPNLGMPQPTEKFLKELARLEKTG